MLFKYPYFIKLTVNEIFFFFCHKFRERVSLEGNEKVGDENFGNLRESLNLVILVLS